MAAVSEWVVREYFEMLGFLVTEPRKYAVSGRKKAEEEVDLLIINPQVREHKLPDRLVWHTEDIRTVARAVVAVRGWHTDRFYASTFEEKEMLRFVEPGAIRFASRALGADSMAKILCLPRLPASGDLKDKAVKVLQDKGVNGIISFETILAELIDRVDTNRNYEKSDLLQILRILKAYDFIKEDLQLEMFAKPHRRPGKRRASDSAAPKDSPSSENPPHA